MTRFIVLDAATYNDLDLTVLYKEMHYIFVKMELNWLVVKNRKSCVTGIFSNEDFEKMFGDVL